MQKDKTPMPDVDDFDPNVDPAGNEGMGRKRDEDIPLPPDVKDREPIEEPNPEPPGVEDPKYAPPQII